ncbi:hypothetical protein OOU_Y34scaffold00666g217 [Pyricularia oryzae Y34]|uniref:Transmembrane protein n=2 Tax=Pyricularia oryzae TaxID=318829 RepID=A0AA97NU27_PYRO3|nr:hypothetical protein OOU_Y34scaffold00666g217 [Pyricularia oryzae Y34]
MQFKSIAAALLLPLVAVNAQDSLITTTMTSTETLTKTISLTRVSTVTSFTGNSTAAPTGTGAVSTRVPTVVPTATSPPTIPDNPASILQVSNMAYAGVAGLVAAMLLLHHSRARASIDTSLHRIAAFSTNTITTNDTTLVATTTSTITQPLPASSTPAPPGSFSN